MAGWELGQFSQIGLLEPSDKMHSCGQCQRRELADRDYVTGHFAPVGQRRDCHVFGFLWPWKQPTTTATVGSTRKYNP